MSELIGGELSKMSDVRIHVFVGAYGSGKTEVSINYAVKLRQEHEKIALIDLDIVNPYFRSREAAEQLEKAGVEVIFPKGQLRTADLPALSPEILSFLQDPDCHVIFDVGGDEVGAIALGRFKPYFREREYEMIFVVNTLRPFTKSVSEIEQKIEQISKTSRLEITHLVANINLVRKTKVEDILKGYTVVKNVAEILHLPIKYLAVEESFQDREEIKRLAEPISYLHLYNRPDWLS